jgi:hypothetical protein
MLANARREYARRLKERFLGSAARFFLRDQDAQGIAKLEGHLVSELDLALRFSAQVWARTTPLHFLGLAEIAAPVQSFLFDESLMTRLQPETADKPEAHEVVLVLQPAVGTLKKIGGAGHVWTKAQVLVTPASTPPRPPTSEEAETPVTAVETITVQLTLAPDTYQPSEPIMRPACTLKPITMPTRPVVSIAEEDATTPRQNKDTAAVKPASPSEVAAVTVEDA